MEKLIKKTSVGIIVGRFQVDDLHEGHHNLIQSVQKLHKKIAIFLGIPPTKASKNNPLDYNTRKVMIQAHYPDITILPIKDVKSHELWSKNLDEKIREVYSIETVTIYGSRDSFIGYYTGGFPTVELEATFKISGSEIRSMISDEVRASKDYRAGAIYACANKYATTFTTVDAAVINEKGEILLARKKDDEKGKFRFIGGFVDINQDASNEEAVKREVAEETNSIGIGEPKYVGSARIDDWRYRSEPDGIMTNFFIVPYVFGSPKATDDIDYLEWMNIQQIIDNEFFIIVEEHKVLFKLLKAYLEKNAELLKGE